MAGFTGVRSLVLLSVILYLLFSECLQAQKVIDPKCKSPWYISVNEKAIVSWTGEDRGGTVEVNITTKDNYGRECTADAFLKISFKVRILRLSNPCSNALYFVTVSLICDGELQRQNMTVRTPPDAPTITDMIPTNSSVLVKWSAPTGVIASYKVILIGSRKQDVQEQVTGHTYWNFTRLQPYTNYDASVQAKNVDHWGKVSASKSAMTFEGVPFEPENLKVTEVSSEHIGLEWDDPEPITGPILRFEISWTEIGTDDVSSVTSENRTYVINNLYPYSKYSIEVAAVNSVGKGPASNLTQVTKLAVPDPPNINITLVTNTTVSVEWKLSDFYRGPDPTYLLRWKEQGESDSYTTEDIQKPSKGDQFSISELKPFTIYEIQIRSRNEAGSGWWSDVQEVKTLIGIPSAPRNLRVFSKSAFHVVIWWDAPIPANGIILQYVVDWIKKTNPSAFSKRENVKTTQFKATGLTPYTDYDFQVHALTEAGFGDRSRWLKVKTEVGVPSEPLNLTTAGVTSTSIWIQWMVPVHKNGPYLYYIIRWAKTDDPDEDYYSDEGVSFIDSREDETNETSYEIMDLDSYTNYSVEVCAKTSAGLGNCTKPLVIQTIAGIPSSPTSLKTVVVQATEITIQWLEPRLTNGPVEGYVIHWGVKGTDGSVVRTSNRFYRALGLRPYTTYFFKTAAETEGGRGPFAIIYKTTDASTPGVPEALQFTETDHCILLKWSPPEHPNSPHLLYTIQWSKVSDKSSTQVSTTNETTYRIRELVPETNYSIQVLAESGVGKSPWTDAIYVRTKEKDHSSAVIAGSVVGSILILFIIACLVVLYLSKKKGGLKNIIPKSHNAPTPSNESFQTTNDALSMEVLNDYGKIDVRNFDEHVLQLMSNGYYKLAQEFHKLGSDSPPFPTNEAKKNDNLTKNRWVKILPFDHSRVKLRPVGDEVEPDFINASYVPGDDYLLEYIATQGPLPNTVNDFWRMVWQESVFLMVMLTQCVERAKRTCERYWPSAGTSTNFGDLEVQTVSESITPAYIQRLFLVSQGGKQRHIVHLHYMNWPVSGCPKSPDDFLSFVRTVRGQVSCGVTGPMLVHCSAGIGRTGTFIAVDRLFQQLNRQCDEVDIYGTVLEMRKYRANLVQTEEQFYFIHLCVQKIIHEKRQELENDYGGGIYSN